jgi:hypothetical protein
LTALALAPTQSSATTDYSLEKLYGPRSNWSIPVGGKLNISSFIFLDVNRNGQYDEPDRPLENVAVLMRDSQDKKVLKWSNFNGFANFTMSKKHEEGVIKQAGRYSFDVQVPPGWSATTDNLVQTLTFREISGSVADIVGDPPFRPVGIVQNLTIHGGIAAPRPGKTANGETVEITAIDPTGGKQSVPLDKRGRFSVPATAGNWTIEIRAGSPAHTFKRVVEVGNVPVQLSFLRPSEKHPEKLRGEKLLDFEQVTPRRLREMPNGIGGLNWWNMVALRVGRAYANNSVSGNYVAYNSSGHPAQITRKQAFDFAGAHFGVAWKRANGETLHLKGWRGDKLVYEDEINLSNLGPIWFDADYRNITRLDLATKHHWQFVTDDMKFRLSR